jgi:hypothetical protein
MGHEQGQSAMVTTTRVNEYARVPDGGCVLLYADVTLCALRCEDASRFNAMISSQGKGAKP